MKPPAWTLLLVPFLAAAADSAPGGNLRVGSGDTAIDLPLRHTKVAIEVTAFVARTTVEQVFDNSLETPVEAVYTFPLGHRAAVDDFELTTGDRTIRGEIKRRDEARKDYETARSGGYRAALLEQERPNIFTQSVANLVPGEPVTVRLRTVETLRYERGSYRLVFPLVVGQRYVSGTAARVPDAGKIVPPRLAKGTRSSHDVEMDVVIDAGVPLRDLKSVSHRIQIQQQGPAKARVRLALDDTIPNKDFQLSWTVGSEQPAVGLLTHRDGLDGFFTLLVQPKGEIDAIEAAPKEITLVVDTSGSMSGIPIAASRRFIAKALHELGPRDTFNIIRFSGDNKVFSREPLPNEPAAIERAIAWVNAGHAGGGTEMLAALRAAFALPRDPNRVRIVVFFTDGEVGNDDEILAAIGGVLGDARIHTVGIGTSVNRHLLDRMAELGRGAFVAIRPNEDTNDALDAFRSWVTRPYLTELTIDWGALPVADVNPDPLPDLSSGQTLSLVGRYLNAAKGDVVVRGKLGGRYWEQRIPVAFPEKETKHDSLASLWARGRIDDLLRGFDEDSSDSIQAEVTSLALDFRLMSRFTSFVAVDDAVVANPGGVAPTIHQALPLPEGVSFEGIFGSGGPRSITGGDGSLPDDHGADDENDADDSLVVQRVIVTANRGTAVDLDTNETSTVFSADFVADLPVAGRFHQNVLSLAPGVQDSDNDGNPNVNGSRERDFKTSVGGATNVDPLSGQFLNLVNSDSIESITVITAGAGAEFGRAHGGFAKIVSAVEDEPLEARARLRDLAFRVLADLADDGRLSPAGGKPALAALLGAQLSEGTIAQDTATHAIATWALVEAAAAMPKEPLLATAKTMAIDHLTSLATPAGWPKHAGGKPDHEATRWAKLALGKIRPDIVSATPVPEGAISKEYSRLQEAIVAKRATAVRGGSNAFDRLVATIGRGRLRSFATAPSTDRPQR